MGNAFQKEKAIQAYWCYFANIVNTSLSRRSNEDRELDELVGHMVKSNAVRSLPKFFSTSTLGNPVFFRTVNFGKRYHFYTVVGVLCNGGPSMELI
jgi:hypothetical protein